VRHEQEGRPLRVGLIGATERVRRRYEALFEGPGQSACVVVDPPAAEVLVVDLDGSGAQAAWAQHRAHAPGTPAVLVGSDPALFPPGSPSLVKPIPPGRLLEVLAGAGARHETTEVMPGSARCRPDSSAEATRADLGSDSPPGVPPGLAGLPSAPREPLTERLDPRLVAAEMPAATDLCGEGDDVDLNDPSQVGRLFLPVERRLLGATLAAVERFRAEADGWVLQLGEGWVRVAPRGGPVHVSFTTSALRGLCQSDLPGVSVRADRMAGSAGRPPPGGAAWDSLEAFLWQLALWTYRGRLPSGTAVHGRVYLARWPNLTRLAEVPHGLRIAALWLSQPASLAFTPQALGVRQRYVFSFYGAVRTIGLAGQARRAADHLFEATRYGAGADGRILSGVIGRLKGFIGA
jgi:hypothetical protein